MTQYYGSKGVEVHGIPIKVEQEAASSLGKIPAQKSIVKVKKQRAAVNHVNNLAYLLNQSATDRVATLHVVCLTTTGPSDKVRMELLLGVPTLVRILTMHTTPHMAKVYILQILGNITVVSCKASAWRQKKAVLPAALSAIRHMLMGSLDMATEDTYSIEMEVVCILRRLTCLHVVNTTIVATEFTDMLVHILMRCTPPPSELLLKTTQLVGHLCAVHQPARGPATAAGGVVALMALLDSPSERIRVAATWALMQMCNNCEHAMDVITTYGGVETLARLHPTLFGAAASTHKTYLEAAAGANACSTLATSQCLL